MPKDPTEEFVRNLIRLQRLGNGLSRDARKRLNGILDDLIAQVAKHDPFSLKTTAGKRRRMVRLLKELDRASKAGYPDLARDIRSAVARVGVDQAAFAKATLTVATGLETAGRFNFNRAKAILDASPFDGDILSGWVEKHRARTVAKMGEELQRASVANDTLGQAITRIKRNVWPTSRRQIEAVARTGMNHIANQAHEEIYRANDDVVSGEEFVAVLDARTTVICARWDGTVFKMDDPNRQVPPLHYQCRSNLVPVIDWKGLGLEPPAEGTRATKDGQVKASTTYEQWFRGQSKTMQDSVIGPARAEMFRDGRLTFKDMIGRDNRIIPIADL